MVIWELATLAILACVGYGVYLALRYSKNKALSARNIVAMLLLLLATLILLFFGIKQTGIHTLRGGTSAIIIAFGISAICAFFVYDLLGGSVPGSSPKATGRRWMNWVIFALMFKMMLHPLVVSMRGEPNALGVAVGALLGLIVAAPAAFGLGALVAFIKSKASSNPSAAPTTPSNKKAWWVAGGVVAVLVMFSMNLAPDDYPSCILKEMPGAENNQVAVAKARDCAQRFQFRPPEFDKFSHTEESRACVVRYASNTGNERAAYLIAAACLMKHGHQ